MKKAYAFLEKVVTEIKKAVVFLGKQVTKTDLLPRRPNYELSVARDDAIKYKSLYTKINRAN